MRLKETGPATESVAVVGMRGRFPGAGSVQALWENLKNGVETISTFTDAELIATGIDPAYLNVPGYVPRGCVLDGVDMFDAGFFGYSARDAETMDPQQRIFMELCWEGLEEAGYDPESYPGAIGVFAGSDQSTYLYQIYQSVDSSAYGYGGMMAISNEKDYVATQVSYKLNLRGPSMAIQTSCSTSLVTVCMACQSLMFGSCDIALAGGIGISVPQRRGYWYQPGAIYSPDGHCRPFDAGGQGTVVGNGAAVVVLKRLSDALEDGDQIHAVIKGFGLNNDGSAKVGYTAPSVDGQARAIRMAQRMAGVEPDSIGYVEAHGTATALGDPIEMAALTKAFRERTNKKQFCAVSALKSNVGHLSSAAGVAGLVKGVLAVKHGQVPKTVHYGTPNPQIDFKNSPFFIASDLLEWPVKDGPRRAGVSSFGVGGTNAHVILEQAPEVPAQNSAPEKQLLVLSARSAAGLEKVTDNLVQHLESHPDLDLADVAFTCQAGRKAFPHRRALVFDRSKREEFLATLKSRDPQRVLSGSTEMRDRPVVFLFSGQGTQYVDMGLELYDTEPVFREHVDTCAAILKGEMNVDIRDLMYPTHDRELAGDKLKQTSITQPALFTIEYALARLWMEWGLKPNAMAGHSIGEYVAACLSGVMELSEALSLVAMRGRLMESMPGGSMLAVSLPESALQPLLGPKLSLAAVNAPSLCVLSGHTEAIEALERRFADEGVMSKRLHTSHAFHSSMMDPVLKQFAARVSRMKLKPPQIPYVSNVTGGWIKPELVMSPQYWSTHLRQTVRFADNLRELMVFPDLTFLEVGPGQTLGFLARQQGSLAKYQLILSSLRSAQEEGSDAEHVRSTVAKLWMGGVSVNWLGVHGREKRRRVPLPTYPFERQRFWIGPLETPAQAPALAAQVEIAEPQRAAAATASAGASLAGSSLVPVQAPKTPPADVADWFFVPTWKPAVGTRTAAESGAARSWLIFSDTTGLGESIVNRLRESGSTVNVVSHGTSFVVDEGSLTIRAAEKADYEALLRALKERSQMPDHILHLWTVDDAQAGTAPVAAFDQAQERGFFSVMYLAQALGKVAGSTQIHLGVVTEQLHAVVGDEELRSYAGTLTGACKVIPQEYPNVRCRLIDVVRGEQSVAETLIADLTREPFAPAIAYRKRRRWTQQYEAVQLGALTEKLSLLRDDGVYLITGGYGNIGLVFAEAIAKQVKAKLVLAGRSSFPERSKWDEFLSAHPRDIKSDQMRKIRRIETLGAEVLLAQADVTDRAQVQALADQVAEKWGRVNGIFHGAANLSTGVFGPIRDIDAAKAKAHFLPKAHGLLLLEEVFASHTPEFYFLLSSLSAVLGGLNLAAYGASNAFLDAEAARQNQAGKTLWITSNWDAWDFAPGADSKADVVSANKGQEAFTRILANSLAQVVVSTTPLSKRLEQWVYMQARPAAPPVPQAATASTPSEAVHKRPELSTQYVAPRTETEKQVAAVWEHLLGVTPIGVYDKFFELGGHSLLAIQLLGNLRDVFDLDLPVQRIFEAPTVAQLSESIDRDKQSAPAAARAAGGEDEKLQEILSLVEGLSEAELDALLSDAEAMQKE